MSELNRLAHQVAESLNATLNLQGGSWCLTMFVDSDDSTRGGEQRSQLVTLDATEDERHILVGTKIGDFDGSIDLEKMLRRMSKAIYARLYITDEDILALEAGVSTEDLDAGRLTKIVRELARLGDDFEHRFVGGDER
jgi:hypothetical protein